MSRLLIPVALLLSAGPGLAAQPATGPDFAAAGLHQPACADAPVPDRPLALADLIDIALCRAPATSAAWAGVRAAAAREAQARAAYGPSLSAAVGPDVSASRRWGGGFPAATDSSASATAQLSLQWLLFDFGGRQAALAGAEAARAAAMASFAGTAQDVVEETALAYNAYVSAMASARAADANAGFAQTSLAAATARERAGVAIKSDRLQADAAYARALLEQRQAQGTLETQRGRLLTALSLPPDGRITVAEPPAPSSAVARASARALLEEAARLRPDLRLQAATLESARAAVAQARAARRPSVSVGAGPSVSVGTQGQDSAVATAGVTMSIPLFNSGGRTAALREAEAERDRAEANLALAGQQAALEVWSRYQDLETASANLETTRRLLASAEEAAALAQGRYKAGLAGITELLDAQSSLTGARQQKVLADLQLRASELQLARSVGAVGDALE
ncbi:TolC family protein [Sandaracinobacter sp.]|uniref:TolC family protein n=1 Tax=Sandaracinobacter sp. TaxID=2487581 RepID=UPI0035B1433E